MRRVAKKGLTRFWLDMVKRLERNRVRVRESKCRERSADPKPCVYFKNMYNSEEEKTGQNEVTKVRIGLSGERENMSRDAG